MSAIDHVLERLQGCKRNGRGYTARCPGHDDRANSLSVTEGNDGRVLVHCFTGCDSEAVVGAIGLKLSDLFPDDRRNGSGGRGGMSTPREPTATVQPSGCTLAQYAEAKQLPMAELRAYGLSDVTYLNSPAVRIPYMDTSGTETAIRFRLELAKAEDGTDNRFRWRKDNKPRLYGLWRLRAAVEAGWVVLVEGESDCHTLWHHGIPAVGVPGASNWRDDRDAGHLDDIQTIYVIQEPDKGGETLLARIGTSLIRQRVRIVSLGDLKDPSGLHLDDPDRFRERFQAALDAAESWTARALARADEQRQDAWERCQTLARQPAILETFADALGATGLVGERRTGKLIYLVGTSRLLERPASAAVKGPSSAGKSFLVEQVLSFFPATAYYALSAMSERALAYSEEPLKHRVFVIYEAAGLTGDFASYLVRSLLSEGCIRYETVEKTKDGLRPKLIEREGPTALLVTTTAVKLHPENETRLFSIPVTDTPAQTEAVIRSLASEVRGTPPDFGPWHALQVWLEGGPRVVTIPWAPTLAELIPPVAVRLRRDVGGVLTLIRAHALVHQASRERDGAGRIVASLDDYAAVRDLVADGVEATVSPTVRETVGAVAGLLAAGGTETTVSAVAKSLNVDKATALRRARVAIDRGYLKNLEDKRGRPARIVLGDPLPDDAAILPTVETLRERLQGCAVAGQTGGIHTPPSPRALVTSNGANGYATPAPRSDLAW